MSIKLQSQVWEECTDVSGTKLLLLLALADFADDQCQCFPKIKTLAGRIRTDERVTRKHMKELKELGYVEVLDDSSGRRSNVYKVHVNPVKKDRSKKTGQKRQVTSDRSNPVKFDTPVLLRNIEPPKEPPIKKGGKPPKEKVDDIPYDEVVALYHKHCPSLKRVRELNDKRKDLISYRFDKGCTLEDFVLAFKGAENNPHNRGESEGGWQAGIDYVLRDGKKGDVFLQCQENAPITEPNPLEPAVEYFEPVSWQEFAKEYPPNTQQQIENGGWKWENLTPAMQQDLTEKCKEL